MSTEGGPGLAYALVGQNVRKIKISDINITERQRKINPADKKFLEHISKLAESIRRVGLLHPITLEDGTNNLQAGFCRIQAFLHLGLNEIPFVYRSELDSVTRKVIELEENLQRLSLEWWEEAAAIAEINNLQIILAQERGEEWTQYKTAEAVGKSTGTVSQALKVVEAIKVNPDLVKAGGLMSALNQIKAGEQLVKRKEQIEKRNAGIIRTYPAEIIVGDALELIRKEPDEEYDAICTNFPFGVDLTIGKEQREVYKDNEGYIIELVRAVTHECYRVLKPDSWMIGFFDVRKITYNNKMMQLYRLLMENPSFKSSTDLVTLLDEAMGLTWWMEQAGFNYVQLLPCMWVKPNKRQGQIGDPNKGFIMAYEAFVLAGKGNPMLMRKGLQNIFLYDTPLGNERDIDVQMPASICTDLVSLVAMGGARILDPFAGSGAFGEGALNNQCSFKGFELDPKRAAVGNLRLQEHVHAAEAKVAGTAK